MKLLIILILLNVGPTLAKVELPVSTMRDIEIFSKKNLDEKKDFAEVKKTIEVLLALDEEDPSRTAVMMLSESYIKNKVIYDRAIKSLENKKNRKQLGEIKSLLSRFYKDGNG